MFLYRAIYVLHELSKAQHIIATLNVSCLSFAIAIFVALSIIYHCGCRLQSVKAMLKLYYDLNRPNLEISCSKHLLGCYCHPDYACYLL